ncbi:serine/threonine protein kinase [Brachybacterium sp. EF45031]|uniref:serine/threonine-protein kinase n=1 Tax=Brachybacterium sillae TaxID=2810536 RepID=UPI00217E455B|nr:serine/threonine-protein kinase [Brachybacterium sillae]MCS6711089.1 serine/threonine protein kinase [Brachybacterium sillae]
MTRRPPAPAPELTGYHYESLLGSGGFADVFLYRQERPQRRVAIKVLLADTSDAAVRSQFDAEADTMAAVSTHPSIVTIHHADVAPDGRPYIVMEYCPHPNYGVRFRRERISVAEVLRTGVQLAGAVETAHRAGILHRDIKPANILVTEYRRPALTDFGISIATTATPEAAENAGLSVPWAPPEYFSDPPTADVRSDVFSLGATLYSLLAGRTPFEEPGGRNSVSELMRRIATEPVPPINRPDVPAELMRVLSTAMAKDPMGRYSSALTLGRALQQIERMLALPVTAVDVLDERLGTLQTGDDAEPGEGPADELEQHTRIRALTLPDGTSGGGMEDDPFAGVAPALEFSRPTVSGTRTVATEHTSPGAGSLAAGPQAAGAEGVATAPRRHDGGASPTDADPAAPPGESRPRRRLPAWVGLLAAVLLVGAVATGSVLSARTLLPEADTGTGDDRGPILIGRQPAAVSDLQLTQIRPQEGVDPALILVEWTPATDFRETDAVQLAWQDLPEGYDRFENLEPVRGRRAMVIEQPSGISSVCLDATVVTEDGQSSDPQETCLTVG